MNFLKSIKISITSVGNILAVAISLSFWLFSRILYDGSYSPFNNWLSDLGNSSKNPSGHIYFDIGCILFGLAFIIHTIGLVKWKTINHKQDSLIRISQYCEFLMALVVIMVGIFSEDYGIIHYIVAGVYFALISIFMTIINIALKVHTKYIKWTFYSGIVSILANFIFMLTFTIGLDIYILEWLAILSALIWVVSIAYNALKLEDPVISTIKIQL
jgi:hypothetical membrane protein